MLNNQSAIVVLLLGALLIAVALTPISKWLAPRLGLMANPRARDIHTRPVPRMGGVAIVLGVMFAVLVLQAQFGFSQLAAIVLGAAFMSFLGLADDRFSLSAYLRLGLQLGAAFVVWYSGVRIQVFQTEWLDAMLTVLWIAGITNSMNFLDNMDGLLAGISTVISAFFLVLAVMNGQYLVAALSAALVGACAGFLFYNLNPASVFMGDSGSMFIGFLLACVAIKLRFAQVPEASWMVPFVLMALPVFDTTLVCISRLRRGKNPLTTPGKDHSSHRIADHGYTKREAVMILYLVCTALGIIGLLISMLDRVSALLLGATVAAAGIYMLWFMEFGPWKLNSPQKTPAPINTSP
jgi:UDP-GlcNAc:undecaprenyl-phosphate GlcNAc-1-phosphate transferase